MPGDRSVNVTGVQREPDDFSPPRPLSEAEKKLRRLQASERAEGEQSREDAEPRRREDRDPPAGG